MTKIAAKTVKAAQSATPAKTVPKAKPAKTVPKAKPATKADIIKVKPDAKKKAASVKEPVHAVVKTIVNKNIVVPKKKIEEVKKTVATKTVKKPVPVVAKTIVDKKNIVVPKKKIEEVKKTVATKTVKKPVEVIAKKTGRAVKAKKNEKIENIEKPAKVEIRGDKAIEKKLNALVHLQRIDSMIDKIRIVRGELPLEVQDLEDEIEGIVHRIANHDTELQSLEEMISGKKAAIKNSNVLIKKYEAQQMKVRNNREYESLAKEMEFQSLEIQLCEKKIKEVKILVDAKKVTIEQSKLLLEERQEEVKIKKSELSDIVAETEKEEKALLSKSNENGKIIEDRLLTAYKKIRKNARNGLAVVMVERDSCGGCFNKIPPQRQLDIRAHKKIIVCEYCGRILVDEGLAAN